MNSQYCVFSMCNPSLLSQHDYLQCTNVYQTNGSCLLFVFASLGYVSVITPSYSNYIQFWNNCLCSISVLILLKYFNFVFPSQGWGYLIHVFSYLYLYILPSNGVVFRCIVLNKNMLIYSQYIFPKPYISSLT